MIVFLVIYAIVLLLFAVAAMQFPESEINDIIFNLYGSAVDAPYVIMFLLLAGIVIVVWKWRIIKRIKYQLLMIFLLPVILIFMVSTSIVPRIIESFDDLIFDVAKIAGYKELKIEPIGQGTFPKWGYGYGKGFPCVDSLQYYTIVNYEHLAPDSLYKILNAHINTKRLCEKYAENLERYNKYCGFSADFYEKSLLINYESHIYDARRNEEFSFISKYIHRRVALIYSFRHNGITTVSTVLYDRDNASPDALSKQWIKEDTVMISR